MDRDFYNEDLEQLLKEKADQYKMYPSDKVWKNVHRKLHTRRKWYGLSFVLFLSGLAYYAIEALITPSSAGKQITSDISNPTVTPASASGAAKTGEATVIPFAIPSRQQPGPGVTARQNNFVLAPATGLTATPTAHEAMVSKLSAANEEPTQTARVYDLRTGLLKDDLQAISGNRIHVAANHETEPLSFATGAGYENIHQPAMPGDVAKLAESNGISEDSKGINWLQEYALHNLTVPALKRFSWQLSFAPTMNYRKLSGGANARMQSDVKNIPIALNIEGDPDKLVNHKPALGFELGSHFLYALNKDLVIKAGLQFNYSRYDIQAYTAPAERATIALNSTAPGIRADSLSSVTRIRNFGGDATEDLMNQYFQFSLPVGFELRVVGGQKLYVGLAGTIQPTYLLNRNTYLITTDYKNYTKEPSLVRRWNFNTGAEVFVAYKTGDLKWQVGPQFRYQLLSSYVKEYPIREHLMEYGIKIGVTKTIR
jgi:hypothetical protein